MKNWVYGILTVLIISGVYIYHTNFSLQSRKNEVVKKIQEDAQKKHLISSREPDRNPLNRLLFEVINYFNQHDFQRNSEESCFSILENEMQESGLKALKCFQNLKEASTTTESQKFHINFSIKTLPVICKVNDKSFCDSLYDRSDKSCVTTYKNCASFTGVDAEPLNSIYFLSIQELIDLETENPK